MLLGLDREMGTLARGKRADLSIWDPQYNVLATLVGGAPVFGAGHLYARSGAPNAAPVSARTVN